MVRAATLIALTLLTGCGKPSKICTSVGPIFLNQRPNELISTTHGRAANTLERCLHDWAYTLAKGPDSARDIAAGILSACESPIGEEAELWARVKGSGYKNPDMFEPDMAAANNEALAKAIFFVTQARAGECPAP